jgi:hypothetical protein
LYNESCDSKIDTPAFSFRWVRSNLILNQVAALDICFIARQHQQYAGGNKRNFGSKPVPYGAMM